MIFRVEYVDNQLNMVFKHTMAAECETDLRNRLNKSFPGNRYEILGWVIIG